MFSSVKEFDAAIYSILKNIMNGESDFFKNLAIDEGDACDALERAVNESLIQGVSLNRSVNGKLSVSKTNPRLSYEGLLFVEQYRG